MSPSKFAVYVRRYRLGNRLSERMHGQPHACEESARTIARELKPTKEGSEPREPEVFVVPVRYRG